MNRYLPPFVLVLSLLTVAAAPNNVADPADVATPEAVVRALA